MREGGSGEDREGAGEEAGRRKGSRTCRLKCDRDGGAGLCGDLFRGRQGRPIWAADSDGGVFGQVGDWTFNLFKLGDGPDDPGAESPVVVGPYAKCYLTCARCVCTSVCVLSRKWGNTLALHVEPLSDLGDRLGRIYWHYSGRIWARGF